MTPIGATLRQERLRRNLDLLEISKELKIAPYLLEAIEAEQFERLPGGVFAKSFVRQYAGLLGLDGDEMAAEVARFIEPPAEPRPVESPDLPPLAGLRLPPMEAWKRVGEGSGGWSGWVRSAAVIVLVTLACSAIYVLWERARTAPQRRQTAAATTQPAPAPSPQTQPAQPPVAQTEPTPNAAAPDAIAPPQQTQPETPASTQPAAPEQTPSGAGPAGLADRTVPAEPQGVPAPSSGNLVHIQITADEPAWVRVSNNGKYLFSGMLNANQTRTVDAEGAVELLLGNAGGVEIQLNGKPIGALGPKGQVRTVQFTSGGFTIVPPSKSASPALPPAPL